MKKSILKAALLAVIAAPLFNACEMDQLPTTSIPNEGSWVTFADATKFNTTIKAELKGLATQGYYYSDYFVDYYQPALGFGNRNGVEYSWQFSSTTTAGYWSSNYNYIVQANNYINNADAVAATMSPDDYPLSAHPTVQFQADSATMHQYKAEAHLMRAWAYYNMALRFCKDYEPATAASDLGLPLVTEVDVTAKPARSSLQATLDFINADLNAALAEVQETEPSGDVVSVQVINALRARVALWSHDYATAYAAATSVINDGNFALVNNAADLLDMFSNNTGSELLFTPFAGPDERSSWDGTVQAYNSSVQAYSPDMIPAKSTIDAYEAGDIRLQTWFMDADVNENDFLASGVKLLNKYPNNAALARQGDSPYACYNQPSAFRVAEMYLIAAEAAYLNGDAANAQKYLNDLRTARNTSTSTKTGSGLFDDIKLEWKREMIGEGQRLFCLKRWHDGFTRNPAAQAANVIYQTSPELFIGATISADNYRWVWEIPSNDLETNQNLVGNW
ncbi:MAG: RagB/SusD family nutrient uptake outer membrane protein [Alloprevotella sp.]|nr:RagB/SusD family nutrient uptake outer membrane protein [Alloprevotella sp.]